MALRFSKQKMIDRLTKEGRASLITDKIVRIMDNLDGQETSASCWKRQVQDEPVYWVVGKNGKGEYVAEVDCE